MSLITRLTWEGRGEEEQGICSLITLRFPESSNCVSPPSKAGVFLQPYGQARCPSYLLRMRRINPPAIRRRTTDDGSGTTGINSPPPVSEKVWSFRYALNGESSARR